MPEFIPVPGNPQERVVTDTVPGTGSSVLSSLEFLPAVLLLTFTSGKKFQVPDPLLPLLGRDWETEA